jgi:hypothetical protein
VIAALVFHWHFQTTHTMIYTSILCTIFSYRFGYEWKTFSGLSINEIIIWLQWRNPNKYINAHLTYTYAFMPLCSTLTTVTRIRAAVPRNRGLISGRRRNFSVPLNVQTDPGAILFSCLLALERLGHEPVPPVLNIFMAWNVIMQRYIFSSAFTRVCTVRDKGVRLSGK